MAWVAAKRGHEVHVYEKRGSLGGQLVPGSVPGHKAELRSLIQFQKKQAEIYGVRCHLDHEVCVEDIKAVNPDVVVLATGAAPLLPTVDGVDKDIVLTFLDVLNSEEPTFKRVVVIGGGPTGLESALHLAEYGCSVTVIEMLPRVGGDLEAITKKVLLQKLNRHAVQIMTETKLSRIEDGGVVVKENHSQDLFIDAERVIIAIGTRPDKKLYKKIKSLGFETYQIGDCLEPRTAKIAIFESALLGRKI
jgi:pyruvate/2-oxoglutarate dehydrogenase complex dihydrolipoamide dehydrogenase (E3) component